MKAFTHLRKFDDDDNQLLALLVSELRNLYKRLEFLLGGDDNDADDDDDVDAEIDLILKSVDDDELFVMLMPLRPVVVAAILYAAFAVVAIAYVDMGNLEIRVTSVENAWNDDDDDDDDNVDNNFDGELQQLLLDMFILLSNAFIGCVRCMPRRPVVITFPLLFLFSSQIPTLLLPLWLFN
uniref:Uncharacterized protein n=1 Tax=Glossina brevipalpis TaxID=37001 RepID=A0A1A9X5B7_9MUSC